MSQDSDRCTLQAQETVQLLELIMPVLTSYIKETSDIDAKVVPTESLSPGKYAAMLSKRGLLALPENPMKHEIVPLVSAILQNSVHTLSPKFLDKLYAGSSPVGILAEVLLAVTNTNVHTYAVSPFLSIVERLVLKELGTLFGFTNAGGLFNPGGAYSNLAALITARNAMFPEIKEFGFSQPASVSDDDNNDDEVEFEQTVMSGATKGRNESVQKEEEILSDIIPYRHARNDGPLVIFASAHAHFSVLRSAIIAGIGKSNVRSIPSPNGYMIISELEKAIKASLAAGERPFFVNATAGTTVLGAFDKIEEIAVLCKKYGLWLHVDGSWGGSLVFSESIHNTNASKFKGCELAHSVTMNPHKLLGVPLLCSALLMKDRKIMPRYDLGNSSLGCGRKGDALKLYMSWKYYGKSGLGQRIDIALGNAKYLKDRLSTGDYAGHFELAAEPEFINVCFWYFPPLHKLDKALVSRYPSAKTCQELFKMLKSEDVSLYEKLISKITKTYHDKLVHTGDFMVDYATVELTNGRHVPHFFRAVFNNPAVEHVHIDRLLNKIDSL
ncbi:hypothetical protein MP638_002074 [Amoeboaphelidium occidentale]|nr:hypothetical protein MP638_002074 [Amoeboaphelidium occidentale]